MKRRHFEGVTRAPVASILACLAVLAVPAVSAAAEPSASPGDAQDSAHGLVAPGAGYGRPDGAQHVRALQRRLRELGQRPGPIDGYYGPLTKAAVERLQRDSGLSVDGIVGPQSRRVLEAESPPLVPGAGYAQPGGSRQVRAVQRRLRALGYRPGPIDGRYGPRTRAAVKRFQRSAGGHASGVLSGRTAIALARADRDEPSRAARGTEPRSDTGQRSRQAGNSADASGATSGGRRTDGPKRAETAADGSVSPAVLLLLALALATACGAVFRWLKRWRPTLGTRSMAGGPMPPPTPNGVMKAAKPSARKRPAKRASKAGAAAEAPRVAKAGPAAKPPQAAKAGPAAKPPQAAKAGPAAKPPRSAKAGPAAEPSRAASARRRRRSARPNAAAVKLRIRNMRASGMTLQAIADRLNAEDVPTLGRGATWRPSSVQAAGGLRRAAAARAAPSGTAAGAAARATGKPVARSRREPPGVREKGGSTERVAGSTERMAGGDRRASANGAVVDEAGAGAKSETWLPATSASSGAARSIVRAAAAETGVEGESAWDVMLAATEAVNNAVQHGRPWPNGCIRFLTEPCDRGLRVEVTDLGTFDSALEPAPLEATSGRGMQIIAALVDRLEVLDGDGQTLVRFEKHRARASSKEGARFERAAHEPAPRDEATAEMATDAGG